VKKTNIQDISDSLLIVHYNLLRALSERTETNTEIRLESALINVKSALDELKHIRVSDESTTVSRRRVWRLWGLEL
jgi:hypothetical protein